MDEFFMNWFHGFDQGLEEMTEEECSRLFSSCAKQCAKDALKHLYRDLFHACNENLDLFFSCLHDVNGVDGEIIEPGKVYDILLGQGPVQHCGVSQQRNGTLMNK